MNDTFKDFLEYLSSIDEAEIAEEINSINSPARFVVADMTPEGLSKCFVEMYHQSVYAALFVMMIYLKKYHEWKNTI